MSSHMMFWCIENRWYGLQIEYDKLLKAKAYVEKHKELTVLGVGSFRFLVWRNNRGG